jgi:DNA-binding XRE family transcriptional regulator
MAMNKEKSNDDFPVDNEEFQQISQIALYIRELRFCYGMTQKDLAENARIHHRTVQNIENGKLNYTLISLIKVISSFNLDLSSLFSDVS